MSGNWKNLSIFIGAATVGAVVAGALALLAGFLALLNNEATSAGVCFVAAGLAFGLLANALLRE